MTDDEVRAAIARAEAMTPGPYTVHRPMQVAAGHAYTIAPPDDQAASVRRRFHPYSDAGREAPVGIGYGRATADGFAAAREDVPALGREVLRLRAENRALRQAVARWRAELDDPPEADDA